MTRRVDRLSLGAGLGLIATGALLLADLEEAIDLGLGLFGGVVAVFLAGSAAAARGDARDRVTAVGGVIAAGGSTSRGSGGP